MNIPNSVVKIGTGAFKDCSKLTNVNIPNSVTTIEASAFEGCTGIESINIPSSVTTIQRNAFGGWTSSQNINCEKQEKGENWSDSWYTGSPQLKWGVSIK